MNPIFIFRCPTCKASWYRSRLGRLWGLYPIGDPLRWLHRGCDCGDGLSHEGEVPEGVFFVWEEQRRM